MEIRPGMVLGKERIITNRSGRYGWPDGSTADVYEFDENGQLVSNPRAKQIKDKGHVLTELTMPDNHFAVLVRNSGQG